MFLRDAVVVGPFLVCCMERPPDLSQVCNCPLLCYHVTMGATCNLFYLNCKPVKCISAAVVFPLPGNVLMCTESILKEESVYICIQEYR